MTHKQKTFKGGRMKKIVEKILTLNKKLDSAPVPHNNRLFQVFKKEGVIEGETDNNGNLKTTKIINYS